MTAAVTQDSAFWVWNLVANVAYGERADVAMPAIQSKITELEGNLLKQTAAVDAAAKELYKTDPAAAVEYVTSFGVETGAPQLLYTPCSNNHSCASVF